MNNYELNAHKKSDTLKWIIAFTLIAVLFVGMFTSLFFNLRDKNDEETPNEETAVTAQAQTNDFSMTMQNTPNIRLMAANNFVDEPTAKPAPTLGVSQTLTAVITPATAENQEVDWSVAWADASNTSTVTNYVTVTPTADGSTTANVTCYQAFSGNIIITVTTRESGYTAECIVTFVGKPTDIEIASTLTAESDGYHVGVGSTYSFDVELSNPFGSVGSGYQNISVELGAVGSVVLGYYEKYNSGGENWYDTSDTTVTLDSLKDNFISVSYSNNVLTVTTIKSIESYYESMSRIDGGRTQQYTNKFRSYVDDCYFTVTITEQNSGLSETINIRFDDAVVTGVAMNTAEMSF